MNHEQWHGQRVFAQQLTPRAVLGKLGLFNQIINSLRFLTAVV
jgi:hypothetical protein